MKKTYTVTRKDGSIVKPGDTITDFRGEKNMFAGCTHPRKVNVVGMQYYPSVFDLTITEAK